MTIKQCLQLNLIVILFLLSACDSKQENTNPAPEPTVTDTASTELLAEPSDSDIEILNNDDKLTANDYELVLTLNEDPSEEVIESPEINEQVISLAVDQIENEVTETPEKSLNTQEKHFCLDLQDVTETSVSVQDACLQISDRLASISLKGCVAAKLKPNQCNSVNQFPILYSEFAPIPPVVPKGRILVIGGTHGDELTSVSMVFRWIEKLNKFHSGLFHWHLVPMMNPDGVLLSAASRTNANGVDLNRNLPSEDWDELALEYWRVKTDKNPRRYPGEKSSNQPESQWLIDEINTFKPDAIISIHAPYGVVDFNARLIDRAPKNIGRLALNLLGTYPGSLGNYAGINRDIPVITLELPHAWVMPTTQETSKIWEDLVKWLRINIDNPGDAASEITE